MKSELIAQCGMNCNICYAYLREKKKCPGCRFFNEIEPVSIVRCKIRNCEIIKMGKIDYCYECKEYPCKILKNLDKRYRTKYNMSEIENLNFIYEYGVDKFIENEVLKWTCIKCNGTINVHRKVCSKCGEEISINNKNSKGGEL
jgi:hypothetical protein